MCTGVRLEVSYLAQHTRFGHRGHIYPTQTKDKRALPYKGLWVCAETRAPYLPRSSSPSAAFVQAAFPPQGSGILPFMHLAWTHHFFSSFYFMLQLMGVSELLHWSCLTHEIRGGNSQGFEGDSHDLKKVLHWNDRTLRKLIDLKTIQLCLCFFLN